MALTRRFLSALGLGKDTVEQILDEQDTTSVKQSALRKQLINDGANAKMVDLLEMKFDLGKIELDNGAIKDWDEISGPIKEKYADVFGKIETIGAGVASPLAGHKAAADPFLDGFDLK